MRVYVTHPNLSINLHGYHLSLFQVDFLLSSRCVSKHNLFGHIHTYLLQALNRMLHFFSLYSVHQKLNVYYLISLLYIAFNVQKMTLITYHPTHERTVPSPDQG